MKKIGKRYHLKGERLFRVRQPLRNAVDEDTNGKSQMGVKRKERKGILKNETS